MNFRAAILISLLSVSSAQAQPAVAESAPPRETSEVVAAGEAVAVIAPDHATITASLSQTAATAADAAAKLDATTAQIKDAVTSLGPKWQLHLRNEQYAPSSQPAGPLVASSAVTVKRDLAIETDEAGRVAAGVNALTKLSGVSVTDVVFSVRNANAEQVELLAKASAAAKSKAEKMAAGLGVKLGRLLSAQLTEEPDGAALRERMAQGESPLTFQDQQLKLYVTVRYEALAQ